MKRFLRWVLTGFCIVGFGQLNSRADLEVSASVQIRAVSDFHAPLAPHGTWVQVDSHGRCWRPARVASGWQPYSNGSWVWTDCGWYWASDEPWSWACYHYGSWVYDPLYGWVWIPGVEWAPAWVYWRVGGGYCGWAPRGPRGVAAAPKNFVFVETARFQEPVKLSAVIGNNSKIINQTREVGGIKYATRNLGGNASQRVTINEGPDADAIGTATGKNLNLVSIREAAERSPAPPDLKPKVRESQKGDQPPAPETPGNRDKTPSEIKPPQHPTSPPDNHPTKPDKPRGKPKKNNAGKGKD